MRDSTYLILPEWDTNLSQVCAIIHIFLKLENTMLWYKRMSHPTFHYLSHIFPSLCPTPNLDMNCKVCELAIYHWSSYHKAPYIPTMPFTIYGDLPTTQIVPIQDGFLHSQIIMHVSVYWVTYWKTSLSKAKFVFIKYFIIIINTSIQKLKVSTLTMVLRILNTP